MAQNFTAVSGSIADPAGIPYANCNITAELVPSGTNPTIGGAAIGGMNRAGCDAGGNFAMNLGSNAVIQPGGTQWKFTVNTNGAPPPLGTGPQTCSATITISGASQSISGNFTCPALGRGTSGSSLAQSVAGSFNGATFNGPYSYVALNGCSPSVEYSGIGQPGNSTDAFDACVAQPVGSSMHQTVAIGGYVNNSAISSGGNENAVGGYFSGRSLASNTATWGANTIVASSNGFTNQKLESLEADINQSSGADSAWTSGLVNGSVMDGVGVYSGGTNRPRAGVLVSNIGTNNFFKVGLQIFPSSDASALLMDLTAGAFNGNSAIKLWKNDGSAVLWGVLNNGNEITTAEVISSGGYEQFTESSTGSYGSVAGSDLLAGDSTLHLLMVNTNASNYHPLRPVEQGSCAMAAATTCTFSTNKAWTGTPLSYVSIDQASTPPATAISAKCSVSGTTGTITAGASNSLTWDCALVGNPN